MAPQGSADTGRYFARFRAWRLNRLGLTKSFAKTCPVTGSLMARCVLLDWHPADSSALKSPLSTACVGTKLSVAGGAVRIVVRWYPKKPNSLSFLIGAPSVPPNWLRRSVSCAAAKKLRALKSPLRTNSNRSPWNWFVPDLVTTLTTDPGCRPYCADRPLVCTLNSCNASGNGNGRFTLEKESLLSAPSMT